MKFDKSKVCVAGLHDVPVGTKGWFADRINELEENATQNSANGCLFQMKGQRDCLYVDELHTVWRLFYPAPEKTHRPFETLEEMDSLLGEVIVMRDGTKRCIITSVENNSGTLFINNMSVTAAFNNYVFDETGEPVGVQI